MTKTAYLVISTWVGSSVVWYAEHYYARIMFGDKRVDVTKKLTKREAAFLNRGEKYKDPTLQSEYKEGEDSGRFVDKDKLAKAAVALFKENSYGYDALLEGEIAVCDPMRMLVGPKDILRHANVLWRKFEGLRGWGCSKEEEPAVQKICDQWEEMVGNYWERN